MTLEERIALAEEAERLLKNPALEAAFSALHEKCVHGMLSASMGDDTTRRLFAERVHVIGEVRNELRRIASDPAIDLFNRRHRAPGVALNTTEG